MATNTLIAYSNKLNKNMKSQHEFESSLNILLSIYKGNIQFSGSREFFLTMYSNINSCLIKMKFDAIKIICNSNAYDTNQKAL